MKLTAALREFCPGRFEITITGNDDEWLFKIIEYYSYTGEGSGEEEGSHVIFEEFGDDLEVLEQKAVKLIRSMEP